MSEQAHAARPAAREPAETETGAVAGPSAGFDSRAALRPPTAEDRQANFRSSVARRNDTGLPDRLKTGIESLSGFSMDDVRVHYGSSKPARLGALAYARGTDIHVGPGQERHLPHEAWHVVQQKQGRVRATAQFKGVGMNDAPDLEREADVMGAAALKSTRPARDLRVQGPGGSAAVQRVLAVQIVTDENEEKVEEVHIAGRPKPLFGGRMGAHTTAWIVYEDMVRRAVTNVSVEQAWQGIRELFEEAKSLPGYKLTPANKAHADRYDEARKILDRTLAADLAEEPRPNRLPLLGKAVEEFLEFRELVPLSVIKLGSRNRDEGGFAEQLRGQTSGDPFEAAAELQDAGSVGVALTDPDDPGMKLLGVPADTPTAGILVLFARQHWQSIMTAYPDAVRSEGGKGWRQLMPAMRDTVLNAIAEVQAQVATRIEQQKKIKSKVGIEPRDARECDERIADADADEKRLKLLRTKVLEEADEEREAAQGGAQGGIQSASASAASSVAPSLQIPFSVSGPAASGSGSLSLTPLSASASSAAPKMEKVYHAVRVAFEGNRIARVQVAGRPPSPLSGTMGAHTVPWMSLVRDLEDSLIGKSLGDAMESLVDAVLEERVQGENWLESVEGAAADGKPVAAIRNALDKLGRASDLLVGGKPGANALQIAIAALLEARSVAPGAITDKAATGGRYEGGSHKILSDFEDSQKLPAATAKRDGKARLERALASMLDVDPETETLLENVRGLKDRYPKSFRAVMNADEVTQQVAEQYAALCEALGDADF